MAAPGPKSRRKASFSISARLNSRVDLETHSNGAIVACLDGYSIPLGTFGAAVGDQARGLRKGVPLIALATEGQTSVKEIDLLVRRLAGQKLLEYRVGRSENESDDQIVIEPQVSEYWPRTPLLSDSDTLVLSRFAYLRRRDNELVLESPRAGALFIIRDPKLAGFLAMLSAPKQLSQLREQDGFPGAEFLALLLDSQIVFKIEGARETNLRLIEGDRSLALWDFHDFLFHTRSTEGRHANPIGGVYPHSGVIAPLPAVRPSWPGPKIGLPAVPAAGPAAELLRERHSTRDFDDGHPITLAELSRFLDGSARILPQASDAADASDGGPLEAARPYPSAGGSWELELYLAVNICEGLPHGFYHYDAADHALARIEVPAQELKALLAGAADAMGVTAPPQILITIAARFGRVSWKYSSIAYALVLKDAGALTEALYLMADGAGLGGCAIGLANIDQFAKMTGIGCHIEGPVGQFALGRRAASRASDLNGHGS